MIATQKKTRRNVLLVLGLAAANLIFFLTIWMSSKYDDVSLDQFIYQAKTSAAGANRSIFNSAVVRVGVFGIAATVLEVGLYLLCTGHFQNRLSAKRLYETLRTKGICSLITNKVTPIVVSLLVVSLTFFSIKMDALAYVYTTNSDSDFIEEN